MEIEVRLFATFRDYLPKNSGSFSVKRSTNTATTASRMAEEVNLPPDVPKIFIVNGNVVTGDYLLRDGDVLSIFPPVAGG